MLDRHNTDWRNGKVGNQIHHGHAVINHDL